MQFFKINVCLEQKNREQNKNDKKINSYRLELINKFKKKKTIASINWLL